MKITRISQDSITVNITFFTNTQTGATQEASITTHIKYLQDTIRTQISTIDPLKNFVFITNLQLKSCTLYQIPYAEYTNLFRLLKNPDKFIPPLELSQLPSTPRSITNPIMELQL